MALSVHKTQTNLEPVLFDYYYRSDNTKSPSMNYTDGVHSRKFVEFGSPHRPTGGVLSSEGGKTIRDFSRRPLSHVI
jgi:hypothetical protein